MKRLLHWLAHLTGWNHGWVETWWHGKTLMVGFRCDCGRLSGIHPSYSLGPVVNINFERDDSQGAAKPARRAIEGSQDG